MPYINNFLMFSKSQAILLPCGNWIFINLKGYVFFIILIISDKSHSFAFLLRLPSGWVLYHLSLGWFFLSAHLLFAKSVSGVEHAPHWDHVSPCLWNLRGCAFQMTSQNCAWAWLIPHGSPGTLRKINWRRLHWTLCKDLRQSRQPACILEKFRRRIRPVIRWNSYIDLFSHWPKEGDTS